MNPTTPKAALIDFITRLACLIIMSTSLLSCTHKVQVASPEPITINMNIKIEHEIKVAVDKELDELFDENEELF